ncbi:Putative cell wall binding repeat 2 [Pedococcus cremeus]|uniref:Putative cell wall binding repeat 2 n=2 Tax=Pedococcus cremeus TaxID=587636 RepID=A0A1H9XJB8_9MICO|nr:Putative cell wall binding repeat 2 [Pedococcus cremeus]
MSTSVRRTTLATAVALAGSLTVGMSAFAAPSTPYQDDADSAWTHVASNDGNKHLYRVAGTDRIATAIKLMNATTKHWSDTVIIARSDNFADALASAPLADVKDAPLLVSKPGSSIDSRVLDAIAQRHFHHVILLGGTGVFTEAARAQLEGMGLTVDRQRGIDRYETAVGIAKRVANDLAMRYRAEGWTFKKTVNVYLATGLAFPDAMGAGAAAADNDGVVLLTAGTKMNASTYKFLKKEWKTIPWFANGIEIHTVGGAAEKAAKSSIEDIADTNTGADRYATAVMLANKFKHPVEKIAVASGETYADGVTAGAWIANHDGPLLLTANASLPKVVANYLFKFADGGTDVVVVGGPGSVSRNVSAQIANLFLL